MGLASFFFPIYLASIDTFLILIVFFSWQDSFSCKLVSFRIAFDGFILHIFYYNNSVLVYSFSYFGDPFKIFIVVIVTIIIIIIIIVIIVLLFIVFIIN